MSEDTAEDKGKVVSLILHEAEDALRRFHQQSQELASGVAFAKKDYLEEHKTNDLIDETFGIVLQAMKEAPDATRKVLLPYLGKGGMWADFTDLVAANPVSRWESRELDKEGGFEYWGLTVNLKNLPEQNRDFVSCIELDVGYVILMGREGKPLGFIDLHPDLLAEERPRVLEKDLVPVGELLQRIAGQDYPVNERELAAFLDDYDEFFAQEGEFGRRSGMAGILNLSTVPFEAKFAIWRHLKNDLEEPRRDQLYRFLQVFQMRGAYLLKAAAEFPEATEALVDLGDGVYEAYLNLYWGAEGVAKETLFNDFKTFLEASQRWVVNQDRLNPKEVAENIAKLGKGLYLAPHIEEENEARRIINSDPSFMVMQALAWTIIMEGYGFEISHAMTTSWNKKLTGNEGGEQFAVDLAQTLRTRTREMVCSLAKYYFKMGEIPLKEHRHWTKEEGAQVVQNLAYVHDALRSEIILVSALAVQGPEGLKDQLKDLPPNFYKAYRDQYAGLPNAQVFWRAILELWQTAAVEKERAKTEKGPSLAERIVAFQKNNLQETISGAETADTEIELARFESIINHEALPEILAMLDSCCGDGLRLTKREVEEILPRNGKRVTRLVGVDVFAGLFPQSYEAMEMRKVLIQNLGLDPELRGQFDIVKGDWSGYSYADGLIPQMAQVISTSMVLREGGIGIIDLPFIEGQGSYEKEIEAFGAQNPDLPEGMMAWKWKSGAGEPERFMFFHYETLIKLWEDAGFEVVNLPKTREARVAYFQKVIAGTADLEANKNDAYDSPVWRAQGRPRITLVVKKVREVEQTDAIVEKLVAFSQGFPVVKEKAQEAA